MLINSFHFVTAKSFALRFVDIIVLVYFVVQRMSVQFRSRYSNDGENKGNSTVISCGNFYPNNSNY